MSRMSSNNDACERGEGRTRGERGIYRAHRAVKKKKKKNQRSKKEEGRKNAAH